MENIAQNPSLYPSTSILLTGATSTQATPVLKVPQSGYLHAAGSRAPSRASDVSSTTAFVEGSSEGATSPVILPGIPLSAEPEQDCVEPCQDVADQGLEKPGAADGAQKSRRRVEYLSPMPVSFFVRNRYENRHYLSEVYGSALEEIKTIPAKNKLRPRPETVGRGWRSYVHPEGQLYFRWKNFYTNSYLYDSDQLEDIEEAADILEKELREHRADLPQNIEIGVEIYVEDDGGKLACYYICDLDAEKVLWLVDCSIDYLVEEENMPIYDEAHLCAPYARYPDIGILQHVQMFPHNRIFSKNRLIELRTVLTYHLHDRATSRTSNAPYDADDLHRFVQIFGDIEIIGDCVSEYDMVKIARMKSLLCAEQLRHYHGTKWARLDANRSVHRNTNTKCDHSWWFNLLSFLFFFTPSLYIKRLDEMWLDMKINHQPWRKFISEIQEDWTASITPSAVILTANVGFLAIQSVDQNGMPTPYRSAGQVVSYISTILTIGNIIACTILARQHRPSSHLHADDALSYLVERAGTRWKAERLAIILSIPTAFFLWGLFTFSAAILWVCFHQTYIPTRIPVLAVAVFSAILVTLVVLNGEWSPPQVVHSVPANMRQQFRKIPVRRWTEQTLKKLSRRMTGLGRRTSSSPAAPSPQPDLEMGKMM
ncbi:hypothetical protein C8Q73DRAFT_724392 [Cubamyces lactineus]|nr:hypothetical protein C8Q73DRAFT_724392 [Cubamyces lactineus]